MNGDSVRESLIEKIQAMMARTVERGATQAEAETAAAKVQELLAKHNLSLAEVATVSHEAFAVRQALTYQVGGAGKPWLDILAMVVSKATFCRVIKTPVTMEDLAHGKATPKDAAYIFIGQEHNVKAGAELLLWLEGSIWEVTKEERRKQPRLLQGGRLGTFLVGVVDAVGDRLRAQRREHEAAEVQLHALVVRHDANNATYVQEHFPRLSRGRRVRTRDDDAYAWGAAAGSRVALSPPSRQLRREA